MTKVYKSREGNRRQPDLPKGVGRGFYFNQAIKGERKTIVTPPAPPTPTPTPTPAPVSPVVMEIEAGEDLASGDFVTFNTAPQNYHYDAGSGQPSALTDLIVFNVSVPDDVQIYGLTLPVPSSQTIPDTFSLTMRIDGTNTTQQCTKTDFAFIDNYYLFDAPIVGNPTTIEYSDEVFSRRNDFILYGEYRKNKVYKATTNESKFTDFIGYVTADVDEGETATINVGGIYPLDTAIQGQLYYLNATGGLTTEPTSTNPKQVGIGVRDGLMIQTKNVEYRTHFTSAVNTYIKFKDFGGSSSDEGKTIILYRPLNSKRFRPSGSGDALLDDAEIDWRSGHFYVDTSSFEPHYWLT